MTAPSALRWRRASRIAPAHHAKWEPRGRRASPEYQNTSRCFALALISKNLQAFILRVTNPTPKELAHLSRNLVDMLLNPVTGVQMRARKTGLTGVVTLPSPTRIDTRVPAVNLVRLPVGMVEVRLQGDDMKRNRLVTETGNESKVPRSTAPISMNWAVFTTSMR